MSFKPTFDAARTDDREKADKMNRILIPVMTVLMGIGVGINLISLLIEKAPVETAGYFVIMAVIICFLRWRRIHLFVLCIVANLMKNWLIEALMNNGLEPMTFAELEINQFYFKGGAYWRPCSNWHFCSAV